jgi:hypothetical protein
MLTEENGSLKSLICRAGFPTKKKTAPAITHRLSFNLDNPRKPPSSGFGRRCSTNGKHVFFEIPNMLWTHKPENKRNKYKKLAIVI